MWSSFLPFLIIISLALSNCTPAEEPQTTTASTAISKEKNKKIPLLIDADTANEIDDIFALLRAVRAPEFDLLGITAAQFHTSPLASDSTAKESQELNEQLMQLLGVEDIPLLMGSQEPLQSLSPQQSAASDFIVTTAHQHSPEQPLNVVILGSCTNVASAILQDSSIVPKLKVHYLGFWHNPFTNSYNKKEFNSGNDTLGVNYLLDKKELDFSVMTATTSIHLHFSKKEVQEQLKAHPDLSQLLLNRWNSYKRWWTEVDPEKELWTMWDVALIEALAQPELSTQQTFQTPTENTPRTIQVHTVIDVPKMKQDYWAHIAKNIQEK